MSKYAILTKMKFPYETVTADILVIGGGGAGLRAAIEAAKQKANVLIVVKEPIGEAHTGLAAGGLNVAIKKPATPKQHFNDTIKGGWQVNNFKLAKIVSQEMPARIYDLESYGVRFDKLPDGSFYTWAGGKQSAPLNLCAGDYTGREMMHGLTAETMRLKIPYLEHHFITKLLKKGKNVVGAIAMDQKTGIIKVILTKATIVAAGGLGKMYLITSNAPTNTGEGYAWGLDVGAKMADMEFVQFHPTGIAKPEKLRGTLVTEKTRGHGGQLFNIKGERFMRKYQPERMELAGRDEVARAIYQEVKEGRGTKSMGVYLDTTRWEKGLVEKMIPDVFNTHMQVGIDIRKTKMEIAPTMHHMMGGFKINEWGETSVPGLFATGEISVSIHGANRLGGNSLAEGQVFGRRAGLYAAKLVKKMKIPTIPQPEVISEIRRIENLTKKKTGVKSVSLLQKLKQIMWDYAGIIRDERRLKKGLKELKKLQKKAGKIKVSGKEEFQQALEVIEMLKVGEMIFISALLRKESRGAHFRSDYPKMDKKWEKNIVIYKVKNSIKTKVVKVVK